ncbi:MAG: PLP-dependent lyase/thiolase [Rhodospirillales bacterium]|nr:PLP-dependent lyase/thiolase [Rhodospirillales bacterium]
MQRPIIEDHAGIIVVRDDLLPGGTKSRFILPFLKSTNSDEVVYATPPEGGAQVALAMCAYQAGKQATLFVAGRQECTEYTQRAEDFGAKIIEVRPGWFSCVQAKAKAYAEERGAFLLPFGLDMPMAINTIADQAALIDYNPEEIWCAAGSGTLSKALQQTWPQARLRAVQVGKPVALASYVAPLPFSRPSKAITPFPSNPFYDAKAWEICERESNGKVLFWNVAG